MIETYLYRIQTDPRASTDPTATAFFGEKVTVEGQEFDKPIAAQVSWRLQDSKTVTFTVDGEEYTLPYYVISAGVTAIADQERAEQTA